MLVKLLILNATILVFNVIAIGALSILITFGGL